MIIDYWPLLRLQLITPRLQLRMPSDTELSELADLAAEGMHQPGERAVPGLMAESSSEGTGPLARAAPLAAPW